MRLSQSQARTIRSLVHSNLGDQAQLRLFGSRTNDKAIGGDIDLLIELPQKIALAKEIGLVAQLEHQLGCPVDVVTTWPGQRPRPIVEIARLTEIPL